jgi:hypothetical protein
MFGFGTRLWVKGVRMTEALSGILSLNHPYFKNPTVPKKGDMPRGGSFSGRLTRQRVPEKGLQN